MTQARAAAAAHIRKARQLKGTITTIKRGRHWKVWVPGRYISTIRIECGQIRIEPGVI